MVKCAYCGELTTGTKEHIVSSSVLDLFPECYLTFDTERNKIHQADPMVKDVCAECNNHRLSYIDKYAKEFIETYFTKQYTEDERIEIEYDYAMVQKMLLKYAFNDLRSHHQDTSFFDDSIISFLLDDADVSPKENVTVLCGLAINVSPVPDAFLGNLKIRWCRNPILFSDSVIKNIDYETGQIYLSDEKPIEKFEDLKVSYVFRFNSVQFLLLCWEKESAEIETHKIVLNMRYPYHLMNICTRPVILPVCTDEVNYHRYEHIHVKWDGLFEIGILRKIASGGKYLGKEIVEKQWKIIEEELRNGHQR